MTAAPLRERTLRRRPARAVTWVDAPPTAQATSVLLLMVSGALLFFLVNIVFVSHLENYTSQQSLYSQLRLSLAEGSTPVGPLGSNGQIVAGGTPVAVMNAPAIGLGREVVVEGTASAQTMIGIGHRRDSVLPCQRGSSVLFARSGAYGGAGNLWAKLSPGNRFSVTMGEGHCTYEVMDQRVSGDTAPQAPTGGDGRLVLTTAAGHPFMPTGVLRIDAKLVTKAFDPPASVVPVGSLPSAEAAMGTDTSNLFALVLLLEGLVAVAIGATWLWHRSGRWQTWILVAPVAVTLGLLTASSIDYLLPNLL